MASPSFAVRRWLPIILWMGVIFFASTDLGSAPHTGSIVMWILRSLFARWLSLHSMQEIHFLIRKSAHLTEYAILGILLWRAFSTPPGSDRDQLARPHPRFAAAALLVAALYACTDEYHQTFVPARTASIHDVAIDTIGAALGIAVFWAATALRSRRLAPPRDRV